MKAEGRKQKAEMKDFVLADFCFLLSAFSFQGGQK